MRQKNPTRACSLQAWRTCHGLEEEEDISGLAKKKPAPAKDQVRLSLKRCPHARYPTTPVR
jgi:hypothetical protein